MATTPASRREKGKRLERLIAETLRHSGLDPNASRMPLSGADSHLKGDVRTELPYTIEAKAQERVQLWSWWDQAREQAHYNPPLLFISANRRPVLAVMDMDTLVHLLKCEKQLDEAILCSSEGGSDKHKPRCTSRSKYKRKVDGTVVPREDV